MITWMQKHKKWLIVTVWISGLSFIGAGFVGWGSYNFSGEKVAYTIGNEEITEREVLIKAETLKDFIKDDTQRREFALNTLITLKGYKDYLRKNNFKITDEEITLEIMNYKEFYVDGKFDKEKYFSVLNENRISPAEFEERIENNLYFKYLNDTFLNTYVTGTETIYTLDKMFSTYDFNYLEVPVKDLNAIVTEDELKEYYKNSGNMFANNKIEIEYIEGEFQNKTEVTKLYVGVKKGLLKSIKKTSKTVDDNFVFEGKKITELGLLEDKINKPLYFDKKYYIFTKYKIDNGLKPFEEVKEEISKIVEKQNIIKKYTDIYSKDLSEFDNKSFKIVKNIPKSKVIQILGVSEDNDAYLKVFNDEVLNTLNKKEFVFSKGDNSFYIFYSTKKTDFDTSKLEEKDNVIIKQVGIQKGNMFSEYFNSIITKKGQ